MRKFLCMLISNSKIDKLRADCDIEWPEKLHAACLAANTHFKRALKSTPFKLMFGRDFNSAYFFRARNMELEEDQLTDDVSIESDTIENIYDPPVDTNDWIPEIHSRRSAQRQLALINIQQDQARQKPTFDSKVQRNK